MSGNMWYLWDATDHGHPKDLDDAVRIFRQISDKPAHPSSAILAFAQRIQDIARFQNAFDEEESATYKNLVDKIKQHDTALHTLDLPYTVRVSLLKVLVETAKFFNLVVYDDQRVMVFLPSGEIFPEKMAIAWTVALEQKSKPAADTDFPQTLADFEDYVEPMIEEMMVKHGFKKESLANYKEPVWLRLGDVGTQYINLGYTEERNGGFCIPASLNIRSEHIEVIHDRFDFLKPVHKTFSIQFLDDLLEKRAMPNKTFKISKHQELLDYLILMEKNFFVIKYSTGY